MPYCGLVQSEEMLYGTLWNQRKLARLNGCGQCRCSETVCRPYWKICSEPCGGSLWAIAQYKCPFIYKLDRDFNEIDRISVQGQWTSRNYMKNISCHCGCLYITTNQGVYQADESGQVLACVKKNSRCKGYNDYLATERGDYSTYTTPSCHCIAKDTYCGMEKVLLCLKKNAAIKKLLVYCHEGCCYVAALVMKEQRYSYLVLVDKIWGSHKKEEEKWLENTTWEDDLTDVPHGDEDQEQYTGYQEKEDFGEWHDKEVQETENDGVFAPELSFLNHGAPGISCIKCQARSNHPISIQEIPTCKMCCRCCDHEAINGIIESVALMEKSLARLLDQEGEKLHKVISGTDDLCKIQRTNDSVTQLVEKITLLEQVLLQKLECIKCREA